METREKLQQIFIENADSRAHLDLMNQSIWGEAQEVAFSNSHVHLTSGMIKLGAHIFYMEKQTGKQII